MGWRRARLRMHAWLAARRSCTPRSESAQPSTLDSRLCSMANRRSESSMVPSERAEEAEEEAGGCVLLAWTAPAVRPTPTILLALRCCCGCCCCCCCCLDCDADWELPSLPLCLLLPPPPPLPPAPVCVDATLTASPSRVEDSASHCCCCWLLLLAAALGEACGLREVKLNLRCRNGLATETHVPVRPAPPCAAKR